MTSTFESTREPQARRTPRSRRSTFLLVAVLLALVASGCGSQTPAYWPDIAVAGDTIYVAETNGQVFALAAETGDTIWSYPPIEQRSGGLLSGCSAPTASDGPFYAAPAVGPDLLYLSSAGERTRSLFRQGENTAGLRALNHLGTLQWEFKGTESRSVAMPVLVGDTVYLASSDNSVYAIDIATRQARWSFETTGWVWATPLVVDDRVYIASMDHSLYAVDASNGELIWQFDGAAGALPAAPAIAEGVLYIGALAGGIYAVDAETGAAVWERALEGGAWATPWIEDGMLYLGTLGGVVYALQVEDGSVVWQSPVGGEVRGTPALTEGTLYVGCEDGKLYAFDAEDGSETVSPLSQAIEKASIYTSPVYDGQRLYVVATNGDVFALDLERNAILWSSNPLTTDQEEG
ncbi:MAG: PQQ-binding-like beta-propeller repeat protein [Anaerolineae bacterium]|nr:PQQ-binding-like beta-propeller repeat protein [Anaerolineae bacterium]